VANSVADSGRDLVARVAPRWASQLDFETIPSANGTDVFEIETRSAHTILRGNSGVALASALNRAIEQLGHGDISWGCGDQLALPATLPPIGQPLRVVSPYRYRYAYNFCTHGYTMAWWQWPEWERELDFLALKGVNLALVIEGQEQVWIDTLAKFGYTDAEVRAWLCAPSHQPWQSMSNIEYYGGPLSRELVARRATLGRQIVSRMRELGIEPMVQGYYGIVPSDFKTRFPRAKVHPQGLWSEMKRPDMLDPLDPMFAEVGAAFYTAQRKLFGPAKFFDADPFHEGGSTEGIDLAAAGQAIYRAMAQSNADATWVLQGWLDNPRQPMIDALDTSHLLILDLQCEAKENWRLRDQFGHTPWLWCVIENFGGNTGLGANLDLVRTQPAHALAEAGPGKGELRGIGALMEGSQTEPALWELFFANAWSASLPDLETWTRDYLRRRYGVGNTSAARAWATLRQTVYAADNGSPLNSVLCARPTLEPYPKARFWGTTQPNYDVAKLMLAWQALLEAAPECGGADGFRYDLVDVGRQVLADLAATYHREILRAYAAKDSAALARAGAKQLGLLRDLDRLLATRREFLLGSWLRDARRWGADAEEQDRLEQCARELITTWNRQDTIADYANRQWSGLVTDVYATRWRLWIETLQSSLADGATLDEKKIAAALREADLSWTRRHNVYASAPAGDSIATSRELFAKYHQRAAD
jgi:alpha-N-acetylglucosaminidase